MIAFPPKFTTKIIKNGNTIEKLSAETKLINKIGESLFQLVTINENTLGLKGERYLRLRCQIVISGIGFK